MRAPSLIYLAEAMVSFTGHEGCEPVISSNSPDPWSTTEVLKASTLATPHISAENNDSSELVAYHPNNDSSEPLAEQLKEVRRRQLPSLVPGHAPIFVNEKQYEPILRWRARRALAKSRIRKPTVKKCKQGGSTGRLNVAEGNKGKTNPGMTQVPISVPDVDFYGPYVATNEDEQHVGEDAYDNIINLEAPDVTEVLKIMLGDKYNTDVSEEFRNMVCLEPPPDFTTLLRAMNNASFDEATDDGYYCVEKVMLRLSGWL